MDTSDPGNCCGISRRSFLLGAGTGLVAGGALGWAGFQALAGRQQEGRPQATPFTGHTVEVKQTAFGMPGSFPGRVVEVHHPGSVTEANAIRRDAVSAMMNRGMCDLTGADAPDAAWRRFFEPGDVVGIKVNPVGYQRRAGVVGAISSPAVLLEVVLGLKLAGVRPRDIIVFERYASEFRQAGYEKVLLEREMKDVRWYTSSSSHDSLAIDGYDNAADQRDRDPHVVGYDPEVFVTMGFANPGTDPKDDRRFRTHTSIIVTRMINKLITIPCLKDHRSAGVTLALKNLSHGLNNNVSRSHISGIYRGSWGDGTAHANPNQCNTFIPLAASQKPIREKATLHILDGLIGVYEGGPGTWNETWGTWPYRSLFFATDPVALDHVGWDIIDTKRAQVGWQPVARMGSCFHPLSKTLAARLAALAASGLPEAAALLAAGQPWPGNQETEAFDRRQPEHIILAGTIGLGTFDASLIEHRRVQL